MFEEIPVFELVDGYLDNIALVTHPAIRELFVALSEEEQIQLKEVQEVQLKVADEEKRIVCGPALVPNKKILRYDKESKEPFYIYFSEETIRKVSEDFLKDKKTHSFNLQHESDTEDLYITESWIIEDPENDKAKALGMEGLPKGTWMLSCKVPDDEVWQRVKNGELRGFSIDGSFLSVEDTLLSKITEILNDVE